MREFGIRPNRELGQNFLIDDNILGVIGRLAELDAADVVLEVGGGLGVLSEYLAPRVAHLHVVEVDRSLAPALEDALAPFDNATLHIADAVRMRFDELSPAPTKVVANLPYGVAATVLLKSIEELPSAELWVAMVQREVAERLAAKPGSKTFGAGWKTVRGTRRSTRTSQASCASADVAPYVFDPGAAASRSATSRCTIPTHSRASGSSSRDLSRTVAATP